eukprot:Clim_evm10s70 gene=Clim_evmTU10s70
MIIKRSDSTWNSLWDKYIDYGTILAFSFLIKAIAGTWPHSGYQEPPKYGDFEAQRHWMEITSNLPLKDWYVQTQDNDLSYWGIDYPPLSAYHAWLFGNIAKFTFPELVELHSSRGMETDGARAFMRISALITDLLVLVPGCHAFSIALEYSEAYQISSRTKTETNNRWKLMTNAMLLLSPVFIDIDHLHFQYNGMAFGLVIWAVALFLTEKWFLGAVMYSCALNFKHMSLYYALPIFGYGLGSSIDYASLTVRWPVFLQLAFGVIFTFAVIWSPIWFVGGVDGMTAVIERMFPFHRGLFEDKVANFWSTTNVLIKWRETFERTLLARLSTLSVAALALPMTALLVLKPRKKYFLLCLFIVSSQFYLFGFQVHEKNIAFVVLPTILLLTFEQNQHALLVQYATIAHLSMFPLLKYEGSATAWLALGIVWTMLTTSFRRRWTHYIDLAVMLLLAFVHVVAPSPERLPDLWTVLLYSVCFIYFGMVHLITTLLVIDDAARSWSTNDGDTTKSPGKSKRL